MGPSSGADHREMLSIADALREGRARLAMTGSTTPGLDAEVLLRYVLNLDRTGLFSRLPEPIDPERLTRFRSLLEQRRRGAPVAYLTGEREFMGLPFCVGPGVLVPRPETEVLVEWALDWLRSRGSGTVVDIGTGSGAIALSIASALGPTWPGSVIAADVSPDALEIATRNRDRLGLASRVQLVRGSLLSWLETPVDLVLANLPYLRPDQIAENPDLAAEPRLALEGGEDGLALIRRLLADAPRVMSSGGAIGLEIDPSQSAQVIALAHKAFPDADVRVLQDLAGLDRHVVVQLPGAVRTV